MSQTRQITKTLKRCLRSQGLTYRDVADALSLSESSVKRLFSQETFSLQRLEEICRFLDMSIYELSRLASAHDDGRGNQLSDEQEEALAADPLLLSYFYLILTGWKPHRIGKRLGLDEPGQQRCLTRLARLGLIDLMPRKQVRLLTDARIHWRANGPIRTRYESRVKREFIDFGFKGSDEVLRLENSELSDASIKVLLRRTGRLAEEFSELAELDRSLPHEQKRGFGLLLGARPWTFWNTIGNLPNMK